MGRKRKAGGKPYGQSDSRESGGSSKLKLHSYADIANSEDEFEAGRDEVLLEEGPDMKRRRKLKDQDEFLQSSDEEVLGYGTGEGESLEGNNHFDRHGLRHGANPRDSVGDEDESQGEDDGDDSEGWGSKKEDYYDADDIESEQNAVEEEREANRIQQKQLQRMTEADFGFDENEWLDSTRGKSEDVEGDDVVREVLPQIEVTEDMPEGERLQILRARYPEFELLAQDFISLQTIHEDLKLAAGATETLLQHDQNPKSKKSADQQTHFRLPIVAIKYHALSAYLGAISMYFVLFTSTSKKVSDTVLAMPAAELQDHPVMDSLVKCRKLWEQVQDMIIPSVAEVAVEELPPAPMGEDPTLCNGTITHDTATTKQAKHKNSKTQRTAKAARAEEEKIHQERLRKTEEDLADLSNLLTPKKLRVSASQALKTKHREKEGDSDFGDETALTPYEVAEKAKRKKSLRFYTSQIAQKSNKRDAAGRDAGGDTDLSYRERLKDRQARLNAEAEKRGKRKAKDTEELGGESDEEDRRIAEELRGQTNENGDEDYYDMVSTRSKQRKSGRKVLADAYAEAVRAGGRVEMQEEVGPDGKRKISYVIEKNKGLMPKRKKDVRNPRVKKRKKFEEKKKKLGSIRQVYKGGEGKGGYGGELTGIKKSLVKSIKL